MRNKDGKVVAKQNLPSKVCVVCHRPFTWRKKWERVWDEVTTCSKSCNAKRRSGMKKEGMGVVEIDAAVDDEDSIVNDVTPDEKEERDQVGTCTTSCDPKDEDEKEIPSEPSNTTTSKKLLRQQHKQAVKAQKQERRAKRMGLAEPQVGRKPCDLCDRQVDLLVRCTIDASLQYKMVCGKCWPSVSGGVPDGISSEYPYYNYGGLWKNRNANLKKRIGNGSARKKTSSLLEEIEKSTRGQEEEEDVASDSDE